MTLSYGKNLLPSTVGFDNLLSTMEEFDRMLGNRTKQVYPPYNIVKYDDNAYEIQMAVAGFGADEIDIETKDNQLTVTGNINKKQNSEQVYLYHGLALRNFKHTFTLNDTVVVQSANIVNGVLKIHLKNIVPEEKKPKKILIG